MTEFADLGLSPTTLEAVAATGYTTATPIQSQAIPVALAGRDVLGIAQTGTGKTAAFTLPMVERLSNGRARARMPRALVLAPTRELADQVAMSFEKYAKGTRLTWALLIGGVSMGDQVAALDKGVDVLIATPGRLLDLFERSKILLTGVQMMVVDEADRMLDMGFIPDIERIFKLTPPNRQTLFFSATMPPEITRLTQQFLKDPTRIEASRPATTAENITQFIARLPVGNPKAKRMALRALIERSDIKNGIVFCNRKTDVDIVAKSLNKHGQDAAPIHGDLDQTTRTRTLESFRAGEIKLLVASDVAARGLDISDISHVFNYDVPHHADDYVHRIGRTGRAGRSGEAYMIVTDNDAKSLDKVLKLIGKTPQEVQLDLDWSEARELPRARSGSGSGSGASGRSSRDKFSRGRPASETSVAAMEPLVPTPSDGDSAERPAAPAGSPRAGRTERPARTERARTERAQTERAQTERTQTGRAERTEAPERAERTERPGRTPRPERTDKPARSRSGAEADNGGREGPDVLGFGSDLPAFMRK